MIGSQAILGSTPDAPAEFLRSLEVDLYPLRDPDKADLIDGCIGELSPFHETFGYYVHGVGPETAVLPRGWESRLVRMENENTAGVVGLCLSPLDLAVSKLCAGREKDVEFVRGMLRHRLVSEAEIRGILPELDSTQARRVTDGLRLCR